MALQTSRCLRVFGAREDASPHERDYLPVVLRQHAHAGPIGDALLQGFTEPRRGVLDAAHMQRSCRDRTAARRTAATDETGCHRAKWSAVTGATEQQIQAAEAGLRCRLPDDYREFLASEDGVERTFGDAYLALWSTEQLVEQNVGYGLWDDAPGLVLIGSNGGGEGIALDYRRCPPGVALVPFISVGWDDAVPQAPSFAAFMNQRARGEGFRFSAEPGEHEAR